MARIRSIKPGFFTSEDVAELPLRARLTWIGLWTHCDDQGRAKDNVKLIKAAVWPLDQVTLSDIEDDLATLAKCGRIVRYEVDGKNYLAVTNWHDHQSPNRPTRSKLPPPPEESGSTHAQSSEPAVSKHGGLMSGEEGIGEEGRGARARDNPPPEHCPKHPSGTLDPCGACGTAKRQRAKWEAEQSGRSKLADLERQRLELKAARMAVAACRICDSDGYRTQPDGTRGGVCDHVRREPGARERAFAATEGAAS